VGRLLQTMPLLRGQPRIDQRCETHCLRLRFPARLAAATVHRGGRPRSTADELCPVVPSTLAPSPDGSSRPVSAWRRSRHRKTAGNPPSPRAATRGGPRSHGQNTHDRPPRMSSRRNGRASSPARACASAYRRIAGGGEPSMAALTQRGAAVVPRFIFSGPRQLTSIRGFRFVPGPRRPSALQTSQRARPLRPGSVFTRAPACATDGQPACDARGTAAHPRPRRRHLEGVAALVTLGITRLGIGAADDANDDERIGEFPIRTGACDCLLPTVVVKIVPVAVPCRLGG